jgi:C_GCAxxG_C_C family probable redox protein
MATKNSNAINRFRSGLNCSQAVLTAFSDDLSFDDDLALCISCGFGSGMGRLQETCGAVTGAFMVMGMHNGKKYQENKDRKEFTYTMIQDFNKKFKLLNGSTNCRSLLNCDLNTEEGQEFARENNLFEKHCEKYVSDSIILVDELIAE